MSSVEELFDEDTMKRMKSELKQVKAKGADFSAKNSSSLQKSQRGGQSGYTDKKFTQKSYSNYNNSNGKKNNFNKGRDGYRSNNSNNNNGRQGKKK